MFKNLAEHTKEARDRAKASFLILTFMAVSSTGAGTSDAPPPPQISLPDIVVRSVEHVSRDPLALLEEFGARASSIAPESAELALVLEQQATPPSHIQSGFSYPAYE